MQVIDHVIMQLTSLRMSQPMWVAIRQFGMVMRDYRRVLPRPEQERGNYPDE